MRYCCPNCFKKDLFLQEELKRISKNKKKCDCCGSARADIIDVKKFVEEFIEPLIDALYNQKDDFSAGKSLLELLKSDFCFLDGLDDDKINTMLKYLTNYDIKKPFVRSNENNENKMIDNWENFKQEFKFKNRFFPNINIISSAFRNLLDYLKLDKKKMPEKLYRARISHDGELFAGKDMKHPPCDKSIAGRANPIGIRCLYAASNENTAIAELRPHKRHSITIAEIRVDDSIKIADLRSPKLSISPFIFRDNNLAENIENIHFLEHLSAELVRPILPKDSSLEYLPTQYLCELIKSYGFGGIVYKSSVGDGDNYAFFTEGKDDELSKLKIITTKLVSITKIEYKI